MVEQALIHSSLVSLDQESVALLDLTVTGQAETEEKRTLQKQAQVTFVLAWGGDISLFQSQLKL